MAYSFNDGHIAVRTVHSVKHVPTHQSSITRHGKVALSVKYVAADLSSITTVPSGTDCQICHELRHTLGHRVKSRDIVPMVSRDFSLYFALVGAGVVDFLVVRGAPGLVSFMQTQHLGHFT